MLNTTLSASVGCFIGLVFSLWSRPVGVTDVILDAMLGTIGGLLVAWFLSPISDSARDPDSLNVAAMSGAVLGALVFVGILKAVRGK